MKGRIRAAWNILRGQPTLYGTMFVGTVTVTNRPGTVFSDCQFRADEEGNGGLRTWKS